MSEFRKHWLLDDSVCYLNHGGFGACPIPVLAAQRRCQDRMESDPSGFLGRQVYAEGLLDAPRNALARFIGADPEGLVFVPNATYGVNAVVRSLRLQPGDELLTTDHAYNACLNALDFAAGCSGAKVVVAEVPFPIDDPSEVLEAVLSRVGPSTRLVMIDHVTSPTGLIFDVERLVEALEPDIPVLVDGAHAPGMVPLDLRALGASYYAGNCHKWMCAPKGVGFLSVRADRTDGVVPPVISHGWNDPRPNRYRRLFDWTGTWDPSPILAIPDAIDFVGSLVEGGWPEVMERNRALMATGRRIVCDALGVPVPAPEEMLGSLAAVITPGSAGAAGTAMSDPLSGVLREGWGIEVPVFGWNGKRLLRMSAQLYNSVSDFERLAAAIGPALGDGQGT